MARVLITAKIFESRPVEEALTIVRDAGHEIEIASISSAYLTKQELYDQLPGISAVMASSEKYSRETFEQFSQLRVISRLGVGFDAIDLEAARDHEVPVMISAGTNDTTVAESTVALMLALARDLGTYFKQASTGDWTRPATTELRNKTVGLLGLGRVGRSVVRRLAGFEVSFVAAEPFPDLEFAEAFNVELVEPHEVFRRADFLTLHTPLTKDTQSIVNETSLGLMQPGSFLVNTARGGLVDESALHSALEAGHIAGAALDVRTSEPPLPGDELEGHPRILPTPHMAGVSAESVERMAIAAANNLVEALRGDWDRDMVVNGVYPG